MCILLFALSDFSFVDLPSVLWYCWLGLLTYKNRLPYNLHSHCVSGDVKHRTNQSSHSAKHYQRARIVAGSPPSGQMKCCTPSFCPVPTIYSKSEW